MAHYEDAAEELSPGSFPTNPAGDFPGRPSRLLEPRVLAGLLKAAAAAHILHQQLFAAWSASSYQAAQTHAANLPKVIQR